MSTFWLFGDRGILPHELCRREVKAVIDMRLQLGDTIWVTDEDGPEAWAYDHWRTRGWILRWRIDGVVSADLGTGGAFPEARWHNEALPSRGDEAGWRVLRLSRMQAMADAFKRQHPNPLGKCLLFRSRTAEGAEDAFVRDVLALLEKECVPYTYYYAPAEDDIARAARAEEKRARRAGRRRGSR